MSINLQSDPLFVGQQSLHFDELPSTNDYLKKLVSEQDPPEGFLVSTKYQTSGRGQIGNRWESQSGKNLLMSVYLKPAFLSAQHFFYLNMSVCLAVADALNFLLPGFQVKWPNDILFDQKKVAGMLIESTIGSKVVQNCVVGIGINVNQTEFKTSKGFVPTSLNKILGKEMNTEYLLKVVLKSLESRYLKLRRGFDLLLEDYFNVLYGYNQMVKARVGGETVDVTIREVQPGGLLVTEIKGEQRVFDFKEIRFLP